MKTKWLSLFFVLSIFSFGQDFGGYYDGVDTSLSGNALKEELHTLITSTHTNQLSYGQVWNVLKESDVDPDNSQNVLLVYGSTNSGTHARSRSKSKNGGGTGDWNREHVYAKSLGTPDLGTGGPGADAHHLRPADVQLNGNRGNELFADGMGAEAGNSNGGWFPGDEWKGDVARMVMYMYVRYGNRCKLTNVALGPRTYHQDIPDVLIKWNLEDPVSDFERQRNNVVHQKQGNRNPFIDHPEWVASIWGGPNVQPTNPTEVIFSEDFNECSAVKFKTVSELSDQNWECTTKYGHDNSGAYQMNAYSGGASIVSKDWLITSTAIDLDNYKDKKLSVYARSKYGNTPLKILYSNDYNGNGMPQNFTWKEVPNATLPTPAGSTEVETNVSADINTLTGKVYFAFLYENPAGVEASRWTVDDFVVKGVKKLATDEVESEVVDFQVYPNPVTNREVFVKGQDLNKIKSVTIYNIEGKVVKTVVNPFIHGNRLDISGLAKGVYFIQTPHRTVKLMVK